MCKRDKGTQGEDSQLAAYLSSSDHVIRRKDSSTKTRPYGLRAVKLFERSKTCSKDSLTPDGLVEPERLWIFDTQTLLKTESNLMVWQKQFDLFSDDSGLLRCR